LLEYWILWLFLATPASSLAHICLLDAPMALFYIGLPCLAHRYLMVESGAGIYLAGISFAIFLDLGISTTPFPSKQAPASKIVAVFFPRHYSHLSPPTEQFL